VELGIPESNRIVLSISRLHFEKHIERIVRSVPGVAAARDDVTFVIVGSGEERESLERLADSLGVHDRMVFTGSVGHEKLPDYYKTADVFVALSDRTNVSNSLHEAMISRLPVVVLNTGRTADVVQNDENGILLTPADLPRVHEVILELLADDERRRVLGERARASADERLPTLEERQVMEAEVAERAVRERASGGGNRT
jgi:glycosyltransferase involved in cell wall biosynthesis